MGVRGAKARPGAGGDATSAGQGAFTILELLLVLCVLSAISVVAIQGWFSRSSVTLRNAANLLASDLRAAQTRAMLRHAPVEFVFHRDGGGYHAHDLGDPELTEASRRYPIDAVFEDVVISSVHLEDGRWLKFDPYGRPSTSAAITLAHRGARCAVVVDAHSARVGVAGER